MNILRGLQIVNEIVESVAYKETCSKYSTVAQLTAPLMFISTYLFDINIHRCRMITWEKRRLRDMERSLRESIPLFSSPA